MQVSTLLRRVGRRLRRGPPRPAALGRMLRATFRPAPVEGAPPALPELLEYSGEFGAELILFLPWCNWLSRQGLLRTRRIRTYRGMRCFYQGMDCLGIEEKDERRYYISPARRALPVRNEHDFDGGGRSPFHLYPDLRRIFAVLPAAGGWEPRDGKPLLVVHNKFNHEWDGKPFNFIPPECLDQVFARLKARFTVVYIRHGAGGPPPPGYSGDEMGQQAFGDGPVLDRHPEVLRFDDLFAAETRAGGTADLNTFKNMLYSRCFLFISVQGGGAHHIALFSGSCLVVLHRRGREVEWAYGDGYYQFMANPAPLRAICRSEAELLDSLALFDDVAVAGDRVLIAPSHAALLRRMSPWEAPPCASP